MLGHERLRLEQSTPNLNGLVRMLDFDGGGQIMDDVEQVARVLGQLFLR